MRDQRPRRTLIPLPPRATPQTHTAPRRAAARSAPNGRLSPSRRSPKRRISALRPRLKLTPADLDDDEMARGCFAPPGPVSDDRTGAGTSWSRRWTRTNADDAELERELISQIDGWASRLRPDPPAPSDDIARLYEGGDTHGAREIIHAGPAAIRKLARRVLGQN